MQRLGAGDGRDERPPATPALVGRDDELLRLVSVVSRAPGVAVVEGEAGIGKTRLVAELAAHPALAGRRLLIGLCCRIREPFPLGPLLDALRDIGAHLDPQRLSPITGVLRPLLPEIADRLPPAPDPLDDRVAERHRVFRAVTGVLATLGETVLVIEDAHWADEQTVDYLGYLLAHLPASLAVVLTYRGEEADLALRAATTRLPPSLSHARIHLRSLDVAQTGSLASALLDSAQPLSEEFAAYLCERTSGLPFAIHELLALLRERGTLVRRGTGWARRALDALDVPAGVRDSVLERVGRLSPAARAVAETTAVLQEPMPLAVLTAAAPLPPTDTLDGLTEALESGLLEERGTRISFRHMLAVQAVYERIPLPRRQALHTRAADAVRQLTPTPLGQLAHHLREAEQFGPWVDAAERAAEQAASLGDDTEAARLLEDVLRTAPLESGRQITLTVKLGYAASRATQPTDVGDLLAGALSKDPPSSARGQLWFLMGLQYERSGADPVEQRAAYLRAVEDLGDHPEIAAWTMVGLGVPMVDDVPPAEHATWLDRALEQVSAIADPASAISVTGKVAMVMVAKGDPRWSGLAEQVITYVAGVHPDSREAGACYSLASDACLAGHHRTVHRLLEVADRNEPNGQAGLHGRTVTLLLAHCSGAWEGLDDAIADDLRTQPVLTHHRRVLETLHACGSAVRGDPEAADSLLEVSLTRLTESGEADALPLPASVYLRLATTRGKAPAALAATADMFTVWRSRGLQTLGVRALPALVDALIAVGRPGEAADHVVRFEDDLRDLDAPLAPAALPHARGLLAAASGDAVGGQALLIEAAEAYDTIPCPYEAAQAREQAATCLFAVGDSRAESVLRSALDRYESLGARWDLDRATQFARGHGVLLRTSHRGGRKGYGEGLSPRERQVAELAAVGRTNREIAELLFVSARTVEGHLRVVLRKLSLRSRTELAHHLGRSRIKNT
ncbi:ATP-binding protein [Streptomyces sp. NPDC059651]|uniref:ATP-binding protein n=1 Tax=Streptomyces sp. NPDC059651 TaxID=3346897 RepID=UPI0036CE4145